MQVKYLPQRHIENAALCVIEEYRRKYTGITGPPIPVEEMVECLRELDYGFDDLPAVLNIPDVLGASWVEDRKIRIDMSLDPVSYPEKKGRYRFTVGHELGHWELHRHLYLAHRGQRTLFKEKPKPSAICRKSTQRQQIEWQANAFSAYLLMPREMTLKAWKARRGDLEPYVAVDEIADLSARWSLDEDEQPTVELAHEIAREFHVSGQAMQIRLVGLGLIRTQAGKGHLFSSGRSS
jgi:hypothetical protein